MAKNNSKQASVGWAYSQMNRAIDAGFYLEAVAIAESLIADRLLSYLRSQGSRIQVKRATVGSLGNDLKAKARGTEAEELADEVITWANKRNQVIHSAAKSEPGTPTKPLDEFSTMSSATAREGCKLARRVDNWHRATKRRDTRAKS